MSKPILVIYHGPACNDGFCAAWVAQKHFAQHLGAKAAVEFLPANYGDRPPSQDTVRDRSVYILDFSYPTTVLLDIAKAAKNVVIIDHHKTAQAELRALDPLPENIELIFDVGRSGAALAWKYFFPDTPTPWLVELVEDRDLWFFWQHESKAINAWLSCQPKDFRVWTTIADELRRPYPIVDQRHAAEDNQLVVCEFTAAAVSKGNAILAYQDVLVDAICRTAREMVVEGHRVLAANTSVLFSEVAGKLAVGRPFGLAWYRDSNGLRRWSARSSNGGIDVSEIAKRFGGGGHRNAAGWESL